MKALFRNKRVLIPLMTGAALLGLVAFDHRLKAVPYTLTAKHIRAPIRLVHLSDLHSCYYGDGQAALIAAIDAQAPDLIVMTGDIADDDMPHNGTHDLLASIGSRYPCYYVTGNHEFMGGEAAEIKDVFRSYGVTVLAGDRIPVAVREDTVYLCGVDDPYGGAAIFRDQLHAALSNLPQDTYTILLTHRPERAEEYAAFGPDLILAGHAHGGQWRIPGLMNGLLAPNQGLLPQYAGGLYQVEDSQMIVSRGLARESTKVPRIFNRPELVVIDLLPEEP